MQLSVVQRILGILLMVFSFTMLPPVAVAGWYGDGAMLPFLLGFLIIFGTGFLFWAPVRKARRELRVRDGFVVVAMFWFVLGLTGAIPLMLSGGRTCPSSTRCSSRCRGSPPRGPRC